MSTLIIRARYFGARSFWGSLGLCLETEKLSPGDIISVRGIMYSNVVIEGGYVPMSEPPRVPFPGHPASPPRNLTRIAKATWLSRRGSNTRARPIYTYSKVT
ncbi:hypothetical protein CIHG_05221 [Coccidioides immitis H538.4]|uniref:Uncharacterized protein n=3 Tax=Coccidioides immitis TaxID=5501 RepID=A0A0J8R2S1_COCIT|nr:hypothetical protein CIRG_08289 [Coccidioides immitis RMSCC 2394]KMU78610.1 hypothetical protein CISG_01650 [Coccidioides immitis RMSCC 3703]KMU87426.1 hypothetical protein CIHG_05221 [Coccidioides immitis H538.4]